MVCFVVYARFQSKSILFGMFLKKNYMIFISDLSYFMGSYHRKYFFTHTYKYVEISKWRIKANKPVS